MNPSINSYDYSLRTDFCLQVTNKVLLEQVERGSNFISSPLSFQVMLSLIAAGSSGDTLRQLLSPLGADGVSDLSSSSAQIINFISPTATGRPTLSFVNGAWLDRSFCWNPPFEKFVKDAYKATVEEVDFANKVDEVVREVNAWAERSINGLIKQLLRGSSLDGETVLVLANALYFKGSWDRRFDPSRTELRDFHLLSGQIVQAPFMTCQRYETHFYGSFDGFKVLQLSSPTKVMEMQEILHVLVSSS
ncbi:hypothetical protein SLE2022_276680 [Rubroshorea leprosula]